MEVEALQPPQEGNTPNQKNTNSEFERLKKKFSIQNNDNEKLLINQYQKLLKETTLKIRQLHKFRRNINDLSITCKQLKDEILEMKINHEEEVVKFDK